MLSVSTVGGGNILYFNEYPSLNFTKKVFYSQLLLSVSVLYGVIHAWKNTNAQTKSV